MLLISIWLLMLFSSKCKKIVCSVHIAVTKTIFVCFSKVLWRGLHKYLWLSRNLPKIYGSSLCTLSWNVTSSRSKAYFLSFSVHHKSNLSFTALSYEINFNLSQTWKATKYSQMRNDKKHKKRIEKIIQSHHHISEQWEIESFLLYFGQV